MSAVPELRLRLLNDAVVHEDGDYVLYWMIAFRRTTHNFSLDRAVEYSNQLGKPLLILEALRCDYPWASDRIHRFVLQGMADNAQACRNSRTLYCPYVETRKGDGRGLLRRLAERASVVVSDDFPAFFLPRMIRAAAKRCPVRFEVVDSNGLLPMREPDKTFLRAFDLRRHLQKNLLPHLAESPDPAPLDKLETDAPIDLPVETTQRWPMADVESICDSDDFMAELPIDHSVCPGVWRGGQQAARDALRDFLKDKLEDYGESRNQPEQEVTSGLSPYLHFGHISVHQVFEETAELVDWTPQSVAPKVTGSSKGWWGVPETVESFLDELITWRELGFNMCSRHEDYDQFDSLPDWARETLDQHASDPREHVYSLDDFENARTHDTLWNAAQRQLVREGRMHNYLRMLWGKKILEWSETPRHALDVMVELNNKYALDGRNPNSYSGIFWVLGRYDRPWGPERPIFGKIRYMSSENTARKVKVKQYQERYAEGVGQRSLGF